MNRIICWLFNHKYKIIKNNVSKSMTLCHLHPMAGLDADCLRCGDKWRDAEFWVDELLGDL